MLRRFLLLITLAAGFPLRSAEKPIELTGDYLDSNLSVDGNIVYKGNASVRGENLLLTADEIRFEKKTETFIATGRVVFTREGARLLADRLEYRRTDGFFSAQDIRLGSPPYFAEGAAAEGTPSEITIRRARLSYGEPGPWQPTVVADTLVISPGRVLRTEKASAGLGHAQPFGLPRWQHELAQPFAASIALDGGYRRSLGAFVEAVALVPVSPGLRVGAGLGVFSARGLMAGPALRYDSPENPGNLRGTFRSGYINDHGEKKTDSRSRPIAEDRAYAEWQHQQRSGDNLTLNAQLNWWKDSDVVRDFRPRAFFPVQEPDNFVEGVYTGANFFVSAFARFQPNRFHAVQEKLPELRFDLLPLAVGNGFYTRFNASAAFVSERYSAWPTPTVPTGPAILRLTVPGPTNLPALPVKRLRTTRLDAYYAIERPFAPTDWLAISPVAGARVTSYSHTIPLGSVLDPSGLSWSVVDHGGTTRVLGELGFDATLRTSGTFDYKNPQWKIDGLRHLFTPRLSYRYIPRGDHGRDRILPIDRESFATYLPPLGLGDTRNLDDLHATNTLRLGFDNIVQTRDPVHGSRDLLVFKVANDFRAKRRPGEHGVSEIHAEIAAMPARWLQFDLYQSFSPRNFALREFNSGVTLRAGTAWSLRFGNNFLRGQIQDYAIDGRRRLNERFEAISRLHYDARKHRFNEQAYGLAHKVGNTWLVSYTVSVYSGRKRESNFGLDVRVDAIRF